MLDKGLQWGNKTKAIHADLGIHVYFGLTGIFRRIRKLTWHIQAYSEPWYIQNHKPRNILNRAEHVQWSILQKLLTAIVVFTN